MATHGGDYHRGDMNIDEHERTYSGFMKVSKWASLYVAALLLLITLWFCTTAGLTLDTSGAKPGWGFALLTVMGAALAAAEAVAIQAPALAPSIVVARSANRNVRGRPARNWPRSDWPGPGDVAFDITYSFSRAAPALGVM